MVCAVKLNGRVTNDLLDGQVPPRWSKDLWRGVAVAFEGPHWPKYHKEPESLSIPDSAVSIRLADAFWGPSRPVTMPDGQEIVPRAFSGKTRRGSLGIYFACLDLALRVMQTSWVVKIRSIGNFWVTLERRCTERGIPPYPVPLPPMIHEDFNILENNTSCSVILGTERYYLPHYCMYEYRNYYHSGNIWVSVTALKPLVTRRLTRMTVGS